jgi:hypothetical protein
MRSVWKVSGIGEAFGAFLKGDAVEECADPAPDRFHRPLGGSAQQVIEFGKTRAPIRHLPAGGEDHHALAALLFPDREMTPEMAQFGQISVVHRG